MPSVLPDRFDKRHDNTMRRFGFRRPSASSDRPGGPILGDTFYETDTDILYTWNGANWVEMGRTGAWNSYTPTTGNITIGNGVLNGRWVRFGRTIHGWMSFGWGTTSSTSGRPRLGLPVTPLTGTVVWGSGRHLDGGIHEYLIVPRWNGGGLLCEFMYATLTTANGVVSNTQPFTPGNGDSLYSGFTYEAAASV